MNKYVNDYISRAAFVNMKLRDPDGATGLSPIDRVERRYIEDMDEVMSENTLPENTRLYRGVTGEYAEQMTRLNPGDVFSDGGYGSTSLSSAVPRESLTTSDALIQIHAPKGTHGVYANALLARTENHQAAASGQYSHQQEFILARGMNYRVINVEQGDGHQIVNVEVI